MSLLWNYFTSNKPPNATEGVKVINTHTRGKVCPIPFSVTADDIKSASQSLRKVAPAQIFVPPPSVSLHGITDKELVWAKSHLRRITEEKEITAFTPKTQIRVETEEKKRVRVKVRRRKRDALPPLPPLPDLDDLPPLVPTNILTPPPPPPSLEMQDAEDNVYLTLARMSRRREEPQATSLLGFYEYEAWNW